MRGCLLPTLQQRPHANTKPPGWGSLSTRAGLVCRDRMSLCSAATSPCHSPRRLLVNPDGDPSPARTPCGRPFASRPEQLLKQHREGRARACGLDGAPLLQGALPRELPRRQPLLLFSSQLQRPSSLGHGDQAEAQEDTIKAHRRTMPLPGPGHARLPVREAPAWG